MSVNESSRWIQRILKENATFRQSASKSRVFVAMTKGVQGVSQKIGHEESAGAESLELMKSKRSKARQGSLRTTSSDFASALGDGESADAELRRLAQDIVQLDKHDPSRANAASKHCDVVAFAMAFQRVHGRTPMQRRL